VADPLGFFGTLEAVITDRLTASAGTSYTRSLLEGGAPKVGQKVGEEAVETVIAALSESDDRFVDEASDLVFHLMVLLRTRDKTLADIAARLEERHGAK
jgi:phosphoribosyl-ATP pyrophosphohydrolase